VNFIVQRYIYPPCWDPNHGLTSTVRVIAINGCEWTQMIVRPVNKSTDR
jgi:hypothetical protein